LLAQVQGSGSGLLLVPLFAACASVATLCSSAMMEMLSNLLRIRNTFYEVVEEASDDETTVAPPLPSAPAAYHRHADFESLPQEKDHSGSPMSAAMPPLGSQQQRQLFQQQVQQPVQQPLPMQHFVYWDAPNSKHFHDSSTHSVLAVTRVAKREATNRRRRRLVKELVFVGSKGTVHDGRALSMRVDVPATVENLECDQAMLHFDGNAFDGHSGCTRYNVQMYVGDAMLSGNEWGSNLGDGWHDYGINEFGGNQKRPVCMLRDIKMKQLLAGNSSFIYLGVRLDPVP